MGITANTEKRTKTQGPQHKLQQTMGITANTEKRTKTQGPNINSNRQWESQQTQRNEPKNKAPT